MADEIDTLLDDAVRYRDLRLADDVNSPPDFNFTRITSYSDFAIKTDDDGKDVTSKKDSSIQVRDTIFQGRGLYANKDIEQGVHLIVAKPLVMVMSWEVSDSEDDEIDSEDELDYDDDDEAAMIEQQPNLEDDYLENVESDDEKSELVGDNEDEEDDERDNMKIAAQQDDKQDDHCDDNDSGDESMPLGEKRNGILILRLLDKIKADPVLWTEKLCQLFPRDEETALNLPPWMCSCTRIGLEIEQGFNELPSLHLFPCEDNEETCKEIQLRLPLIVRYNVLSVETAPEQYSHFDSEKGMVELNGTALYGPEVSYLNHSGNPNLSRMSIGDVMFFVTNRAIPRGDQLSFSYIEHEILCESEEKRTAILDMDFKDFDEDDNDSPDQISNKKQRVASAKRGGKGNLKTGPMIDAVVQNEIMSTQPFERLDLILDLLNNPEPVDPEQDFQCDRYTLHSLRAITLDQLGRCADALPDWQRCIDFATKTFPPIDENTMNFHVQAALCAKHAKKIDIATDHARKALEMHNKIWGGGNELFLKRYEGDFSKPLRPISQEQMAVDVEQLFGSNKNKLV